MAEALKTFFSPELVRRLSAEVARVHPAFPTRAFVAQASAGLEELDLLDRARKIADALAAHLPPSYPDAIDVLIRSLGPEHATDELLGVGMAPFFYMPHVIFVAERGLEHFEALDARPARTHPSLQRRVEHPGVHRSRSGADVPPAASLGEGPERARPSPRLRGHAPAPPLGGAGGMARREPGAGPRAPRAAEGRSGDAGPAQRGQQPERPGKGPAGPAGPRRAPAGSTGRRTSGARSSSTRCGAR